MNSISLKGVVLWVLSHFELSNMNKMGPLHRVWQVFYNCKAALSKQRNSFVCFKNTQ